MKHIKLFENFNVPSEGLIFDWLPFQNESENPMQKNIPESLNLSELEVFSSTASPEIKKLGLFISHVPKKSGGFQRYIATSLNPLIFNLTTWDSNFKKESEFDNVDLKEINMDALSKGASIISRFGGFKN